MHISIAGVWRGNGNCEHLITVRLPTASNGIDSKSDKAIQSMQVGVIKFAFAP
jgi:hypothetical protein